ncbi:DUF1700 domain-containing protein [Streptococcus suis]|uniref:DUF1700 domain-containing protein n=1 Tax=Streptococcus suis TaxID=1307 RepID=UPI0005CCD67F|nr:DUF1700 domain-containing protein [Streptococcus suis]MCK3948850.1 DUF1700 domain-containing protein [Streptococcus suis]MCK3962299.1 DUF1700 domain-containing protein [Streptococcus suis]MDE1695136.1 DUF1700 domain-containing protein [Streptococcus suis]MEE3813990.1 DUF1700 domain-containing protein [Streptococcus suis]NQG41951.1 DUF1700 domain-containing protein [Streptococcus suis]
MNRKEYLQNLEKYLKNLSKEDFQDTLDYFNEYFDEKENDEQAIQELGSPKEAAHEILANLYDKEKTEDKPNTRNMVWLTILAILAAPIGVPLAITLVALFITLLLIIFSLFLLLISLWIVLFSLTIAQLLLAFDLFTLSWSTSLLFTGLALFCLPLTLLGSKFTLDLESKTFLLVLHWIQRKIRKGGYYETT